MTLVIRLSFVVLLFASPGWAQKNANSFAGEIRAATDSIRQFMSKEKIPGLAICVAVKGNVVWKQGFGFADLEQQVPVDPSKTKFRTGSISKALTAAALGKLMMDNKIQVDSSIYFYLPAYPKHRYRPTVKQIAGHIGGIRHYKGDEFWIRDHYGSVHEALKIFKNDSLIYKPGTKYMYSSHGFNLLSAVLEKASGKRFLDLMNTSVFQPLNMTQTSADQNDDIIAYRARPYEIGGNGWKNAPYVDNSYKWAGGGFISTAEDISIFANAMMNGSLLKPAIVAQLTTPQKLLDGTATSYGMGFFKGINLHNKEYYGHSGGSVGGTSQMVIFPAEQVTVVILTNLSGVDYKDLQHNLALLFMK